MAETDEATPPHAADDPPWCVCGDHGAPDFGLLYAQPGAAGATVLTFDRAGRKHALTMLSGREAGSDVTLHGRRFSVAVGGEPRSGEDFP